MATKVTANVFLKKLWFALLLVGICTLQPTKLYARVLPLTHTEATKHSSNLISEFETDEKQFNGTVTGRVVDSETGEPLVGVTAILEGTGYGDATNMDGYFTIQNVPPGNFQLKISYIGYNTNILDITVIDGQTTNLTVRLVLATSELGDVVVTAFGVEREKRALGYSIQGIGSEEIARTGSNNLLNSLQGQVSGVQINKGGGGAGQGSQIFIRGFSSLDPSANNQPLFVVDGVPIDNSTNESAGRVRGMSNRAVDLDPNDIESISVLKSAPATALYGVRAANGAIIITTKKGEPGDIQIDFSHSVSREDIINRPNYQSEFGPGFGFVSDPDGFWPSWGGHPLAILPTLLITITGKIQCRQATGLITRLACPVERKKLDFILPFRTLRIAALFQIMTGKEPLYV